MERYLAGDLDDQSSATFLAEVRRDPAALAALGRMVVQQSLLVECFRARASNGGSGDMAHPGGAARSKRLRQRYRTARLSRAASGGRRWIAVVSAIAAGLVLAIGGWSLWPQPLGRLDDGSPVYAGRPLVVATATHLRLLGEDTSLAMGAGTALVIDAGSSGRHVRLAHGRIEAVVAPQSPGRPLVLSTGEARCTVLGTRLVLTASPGQTLLEVTSGRVAAQRGSGGDAVEVAADQYLRLRPSLPLAVRTQAPALDLDKDLLGWWPCDEGAGDMVSDASGYDRPGRRNGATWTTGRFGGALAFEGEFGGDRVDLGWQQPGRLPGMSISAWIRTDSRRFGAVFSGGCVIGHGASTQGMPESESPEADNQAGYVGFIDFLAGEGQTLRSQRRVNDGIWHHLVWWWRDDGWARLYIDGEHEVSTAGPTWQKNPWERWYWAIGADSDRLVWNFQGAIDEVRVYGRALEDDEIRQLAGR